MNPSSFTRLGAALGILLFVIACSSGDDETGPENIAYRLPATLQATDSIRYLVEGGGNIDFTIEDGADHFAVSVTTWEFADSSEMFEVPKADLGSPAADLADSLFAGTVDIGGTIYVDESATGTWNYVYIRNDREWLRVANESLIDGLRPFRDAARDTLEARANDTGEDTPQQASVIFLHHSVGGVVWSGGVEAELETYNTAHSTDYTITELAYPNTPYPWDNYPYDYWHLWVEDGGQAAAEGVPRLESFTDTYDVVVFKHCYPVSGIVADTGSPDISSSTKSIENYQLQYAALKERLHGFPDNRFIVWTGAALVAAASSPDAGQRARQFSTWVKEEWDEPGDNIFVWDFYELETEGGNFLLDQYAAGTGDPHPNSAFAQTAAPYFAQRIIDVIRGDGDLGELTGQ